MNRYLRAGFLGFAVLTSIGGEAMASKTVIQAKGAAADGSFDLEEEIACAEGSTALRSTHVGISMFEITTTTNGAASTVLQTSAGVTRFDGCTFQSSFGFGLFEGLGDLQLTALKTGRMTGHFTLSDGTTLDVNLTLAGSDITDKGSSTRRSILGPVMVIQRSKGSSRTATLSGTVAVDGQTITSAQMLNPDGNIARNTGGEITLIKP